MNKIIKSTIMFKFKNQKVNFYYAVPKITQNNQIFEIFWNSIVLLS